MAVKTVDNTEYENLRRDLKDKKLRNLYIFYGEEDYLKENMLAAIRKMLVAGSEDMNLTVLSEKEATPQAVFDALESLPVFNNYRLVIVRDYDIMRPDEKTKKVWLEILENIPDYAYIIFVYDRLDFEQNDKNGRKKTPDKEINKLVNEKKAAVGFPSAPESSLVNWITRHFESHGKECSAQEAHYLIHVCGNKMTVLQNEIAKTAAYCKKDRIDKSDIDAVGTRVIDTVLYDLTNALTETRTADALRFAGELAALRTDEITVINGISRNVRQIYFAKAAIAAGRGEYEMPALLGMSAYPAKLACRAARRLEMRTLREWTIICADADFALKNERRKDIQIDLLIARMAAAV